MRPSIDQLSETLHSLFLLTENELESECQAATADESSLTTEQLLVRLSETGRLTPWQRSRMEANSAHELILGNYLLLNRIGQGGMGEVFKAIHRRMKRVVALKVLHRDALSTDDKARFQREIQAAARLNHPNAVAAYDADECLQCDFLVMEYVDGDNLRDLVEKSGPMSIPQAIDAVRQAARALSYAHSHGVVHRDIKPANLIKDREGCVKVADLGLARLAGDDSEESFSLTKAGTLAGTVDYMAPEQALDSSTVGPQADIYSLGCTLFFLLTGEPIFVGKTLMTRLMAHKCNPPPELHQVVEGANSRLNDIFHKMVAKEVRDRYQSMDEVISELDSYDLDQRTSSHDDEHGWHPESTNVLLVEGSRIQSVMIANVLKELNVETIHACHNGTEALKRLRSAPVDLILVSMLLRDMSGVELLEQIRQDASYSGTALLLMTSDDARDSIVEQLSHLEKAALITKPFNAAKLGSAINEVLNQESRSGHVEEGFDGLRVLIVDDSAVARVRIRNTLASLGFTDFTQADDGQSAIPILEANQFDLVVTDYNMPRMNGRDLVAWIRQRSTQREVPIVMVTTEFDPEKLSEVYHLGASAICGKSFDMELVRHIVAKLFTKESSNFSTCKKV